MANQTKEFQMISFYFASAMSTTFTIVCMLDITDVIVKNLVIYFWICAWN